jgi:hypothetical protein
MADKVAEHQNRRPTGIRSALLLVEQAIDILDLAGAPDDIAAHLDLARHRLEACLYLDE